MGYVDKITRSVLQKDYNHETPDKPRSVDFHKACTRALKEMVISYGYIVHTGKPNWKDFSAFVEDPKTNKYVYVSCEYQDEDDTRWGNHVLYRTAKSLTDYTGGRNNFTSFDSLGESIHRLLESVKSTATETVNNFLGSAEVEKYGDAVVRALGGKEVSKSASQLNAPGGLVYEAKELKMDWRDLLVTLEGLCYLGRAGETDDSTYIVYAEEPLTAEEPHKFMSFPNGFSREYAESRTSFQGDTIVASLNELTKVLGQPIDYCVSDVSETENRASGFLWEGITSSGYPWRLYNWKTGVDVKNNPDTPISWNISASNVSQSIDVLEEMRYILDNNIYSASEGVTSMLIPKIASAAIKTDTKDKVSNKITEMKQNLNELENLKGDIDAMENVTIPEDLTDLDNTDTFEPVEELAAIDKYSIINGFSIPLNDLALSIENAIKHVPEGKEMLLEIQESLLVQVGKLEVLKEQFLDFNASIEQGIEEGEKFFEGTDKDYSWEEEFSDDEENEIFEGEESEDFIYDNLLLDEREAKHAPTEAAACEKKWRR